MKVPINIDSCFRADEIRRIGLALKYDALRKRCRRALLEDLDRTLPDYERPLKKMERTYKGVSLRTLVKYLLP